MDTILAAITAIFMGYQTIAPEFRHSGLYTFMLDDNTSEVVVINTQTGRLYRCTKEYECDSGKDLKPKGDTD